MRTLVVGDIHGESRLLRNVLGLAGYTPGIDKLVLIGDYIDRGLDSLGTLQLVRDLVAGGAVALRGNHDQMMIDVLAGRWDMGTWLDNGAQATIDSFTLNSPNRRWRPTAAEWAGFLMSLPTLHIDGTYMFVHAGVRPHDRNQFDEDLLWIRDDFLYCSDEPMPGYTVVFGHTMTHMIEGHGKTIPWFAPGRIGVDTGACRTGKLTCLELPSLQYWQT
ncbi:MAG TPA: metallophosphoesterase family protein [Spirochaetia bacterium]|nr:metallophosphoesterase family protein [Spirochaetia bacterium]